ncbi:hypothetical protein FHU30_007078 [Actinomadura rupiterrae]|nr:hypothetical protein [Actinomadura rupiterrae]
MRRSAPVRRRVNGQELLLCVGLVLTLLVAYVLLQIITVVATLTLNMPAPHTVAAAVTALLVLAGAGPARWVTAVVVRRTTTARRGRPV